MWWLLLVACTGQPEGPDPASAPEPPPPVVAPAPESPPKPTEGPSPEPIAPSPAATRPVLADPCATLAGVYESVERLECGRGAFCQWRITFEGGAYSWRYSDLAESGTYTCAGGTLSGTVRSGDAREGTLDGDALTWQGARYQPAASD